MKLFSKSIILVFTMFTLTLGGCVSSTSRESTGQYIDSAAVTTKVKANLVRELGLVHATHIDVSTYKGVVQLSGFVTSQDDIDAAVDVAKNIEGVVAVENSLLIRKNLT